jgi:hypothetical protein
MSEFLINNAIKIIEEHILTIEGEDYEKFRALFSPKIQMDIDKDVFQRAVILYNKVPLRIGAIDKESSVVLSEDEILLKLVKTGRKFCRLIKMEGKWLADDIYWFPEKAMSVDEMKELIDKKYGPPTAIKLTMPGIDEDLSDDDGGNIFPKDMEVDDSENQNSVQPAQPNQQPQPSQQLPQTQQPQPSQQPPSNPSPQPPKKNA